MKHNLLFSLAGTAISIDAALHGTPMAPLFRFLAGGLFAFSLVFATALFVDKETE